MARISKDLLTRLFNREQSFGEQMTIQSAFDDERKLHELRSASRECWDETDQRVLPGDPDFKQLYRRVYRQISNTTTINRPNRLVGYLYRAAAILVVPLLISTIYLFVHESTVHPHAVELSFESPNGVRSQFLLPDGTRGWLNSGSKLHYSSEEDQQRQVDLVGEAYFNVAHDRSRPFHINAGSFDIEVTGTSFNVYAFPEEAVADVVLEEGTVKVTRTLAREHATMTPGQRFSLNQHDGTARLTRVDPSQYTNWIEGKLQIEDEPMELAIRKLKRYYNIDIETTDPRILSFRFRAMLQNETLQNLAQFMEISMPVDVILVPAQTLADGTLGRQKLILKPI